MIIGVFALAQLGPIKALLANGVQEIQWPGLNITKPTGAAANTVFRFNWLPSGGTLLIFCGLITMPMLRVGLGRSLRTYVETLDQLKWRSSR